MILETYNLFTVNETWGWTPDQIANLTDWQIENMYLKPAHERAERFERERKGLPLLQSEFEKRREENADKPPPPKIMMMHMFTSFFGMSPEDAEKEYNRQLAVEEKRKAVKHA